MRVKYDPFRMFMQEKAGDIIALQEQMIVAEGEHSKRVLEVNGLEWGPEHTESPDKLDRLSFLANIGGYDIYRGGDTTGFRFIMIRSNEGGDYITTDHPINYIRGFFDPDRH